MDHDPKYLQDDLNLAQSMYFAGEQVFPMWEALYAGISAGLLVAYFEVDQPMGKAALAIFGLWLSLHWARIISRAILYSIARLNHMKELSAMLRAAIAKEAGKDESEVRVYRTLEAQSEWVRAKEGISWWTRGKATDLRIALPRVIAAGWFCLVAWSVVVAWVGEGGS